MIRATITYPGVFIDKPAMSIIDFDENEIALEKKNEETGKFEKFTISDIFDIFQKKRVFIKENIDIEDQVDYTYFETWFYEKHLRNKPYYNRILNITFNKI